MKLTRKILSRWACGIMFVWLLCAAGALSAQTTSFSFTLDEPCKTSAGVFAPDGTLIRTLWSKVRYYAAGNYSAVWDGLDDNGNAVAAGVYQIKLLQQNTEYVWDGAIGNTSADRSGPTVHTGFYPIQDMTITGTNAFYVTGYNEGEYDFRQFFTTDPQRVTLRWSADGRPANIYDRTWNWTATDGNRVYFACAAATNPNNTTTDDHPGFVVASKVGDNNPALFTQGVPIVNGANTNTIYPNGIYVGTQPGLSGLAVQQSGNLLAASVAPDNKVYLLDKQSGATLNSLNVISPGRLSFSSDGSLWIISGNKIVCYTNLNSSPSAAVTIANFSEPLAVAVNPANPNVILVADGGSSQQMKAFDRAGTSLWTYGLAGGYQTNGVAVATNKFWFNTGEGDGTFLCFAPDGSFWIGDGGNYRVLHFSGARNYLEQIMYQPHSYTACIDQNNTSRVFNQFLEFKVDYTKPLSQSWTLVNNWKANVDANHIGWNEGIYEVTTFSNGRTYGLIDNSLGSPAWKELCELGTNYLRLTGIFPLKNAGWISLGPDGSVRVTSIGVATWYETTLNSFDTNGNPVWNPMTLLASASNGNSDPIPRCCSFGNIRATISTNNILISFDQSLNNGWHLGGIKMGGTNWLWKASPSGNLNGLGNYEIANGVQYGGNTVQVIDRNVIYGYHGEFFRNEGQACQTMHYYDDGLFVGQFGETTPGHSSWEGAIPAIASNAHSPSLMKTTNGDYYLWVNDEGGHGPQRWHFVNARNIREQSGSGTLGGAITLTSPAYGFPSRVTGKNGNKSVELSWLPVQGAASYNIRYSLMNGGPYNVLAGNTTNLNYVVGGLTNGQTYYFAVTAIQAGVEGMPSEQVAINPFDISQNVFLAGSMSEGGSFTPVIDINSSAPAAGQPSYGNAEHMGGGLNLRELDDYGFGNLENETVGTKGYNLFGYEGPSTGLANILAPFMPITGAGWYDNGNLQRQFRVDSVLAMNHGMSPNPVGTLNISVTDTNFHYMTIVSPSEFNNARKFTMGITSANGGTVQYAINENPGLSHVFQFKFKGNITVTADATGGSGAIIQAIFFDDALVTYKPITIPPTPPPPVSGFHRIGS
jgi:FlgD Ig-like domain/Fibronectin type III domain